MSRRVVVATGDVLGAQMAGPAIRAWHFARALSAEHDVELVTSASCTRPAEAGFGVRHIDSVDDLVGRTDVWVVQGSILHDFPAIERSAAAVVVDLYDPYHLGNLEMSRERSHRDRLARVHNATAVLNNAMRRGDFFLAASDQQRRFWIGALAALGRVNPLVYDEDVTLRALIDIAPFGVDARPPVHDKPVLRGVVPGIGLNDKLLLWGGGLYNWFDPQTLVRAVDRTRQHRDDVRLVFLGGRHPNPAVPAMRTANETRDLADRLGLTGRSVFFNDGWVPYDERGAYLLEADIGVSTHLDHVETEFSFRTRILDYLWAGLPVVATGGDVFSDLLTNHGAGLTVPAGDIDALASALLALLDDDARRVGCAAASRELAESFRWDRVVAPLLTFCRDPRRAPDLIDRTASDNRAHPFDVVRAPTPGPSGWRGEVALARQYLDRGGVGLLARRAATRLGKLARGRTQ